MHLPVFQKSRRIMYGRSSPETYQAQQDDSKVVSSDNMIHYAVSTMYHTVYRHVCAVDASFWGSIITTAHSSEYYRGKSYFEY